MRSRKSYILGVLLLVAVVAAMMFAVACGGEDEPTEEPSAAATSATDIATQILGQAPTGQAKEIIDAGTMSVNNDPKYPPQSSIDEATGELVGFDVDVANKVGEILGLDVTFVDYKFEQILTDVNQGRYDVSIGSMTITTERLAKVDMTEPYYFTPAGIIVKEGGPQIAGVEDLAGKKVGAAAGTTYYAWLEENSDADIVVYDTDASMFPDLAQGTARIAFGFTAVPTAIEAIRQGQPFELSGDPLYYEDLAFAIKKGEADWLALLNYAIQQMHEDGSLTAMSEKWYAGVDLTQKAQ